MKLGSTKDMTSDSTEKGSQGVVFGPRMSKSSKSCEKTDLIERIANNSSIPSTSLEKSPAFARPRWANLGIFIPILMYRLLASRVTTRGIGQLFLVGESHLDSRRPRPARTQTDKSNQVVRILDGPSRSTVARVRLFTDADKVSGFSGSVPSLGDLRGCSGWGT